MIWGSQGAGAGRCRRDRSHGIYGSVGSALPNKRIRGQSATREVYRARYIPHFKNKSPSEQMLPSTWPPPLVGSCLCLSQREIGLFRSVKSMIVSRRDENSNLQSSYANGSIR
jgi:hypothetical protein